MAFVGTLSASQHRTLVALAETALPAGRFIPAADERTVAIRVGPDPRCMTIAADLGRPDHSHREPRGLVILAHGGGSSRQSYRNRYLAGRLRLAGWATLRVDLLLEHGADAARGIR